jgi:hypothetical protein
MDAQQYVTPVKERKKGGDFTILTRIKKHYEMQVTIQLNQYYITRLAFLIKIPLSTKNVVIY